MMQAQDRRNYLLESISHNCRKLKLTQRVYDNCIDLQDKELELIHNLFSDEVNTRIELKKLKRIRAAGFPLRKNINEFEFERIKWNNQITKEKLLSLDFINQKDNLILKGSYGRGKTHLAISLGELACRAGFNVKFYTVFNLMNQLKKAHEKDELYNFLETLAGVDLLILDEWGNEHIDYLGCSLLFKVITESYELTSIIITTNHNLEEWREFISDVNIASGIMDKVFHHAILLEFVGESYRLMNSSLKSHNQRKNP